MTGALLAIATLGVACSQSSGVRPAPTPTASCRPLDIPALPLQAEVLYPITNATSVPDGAAVVVYEQFSGATPVPIALAAATASPVALAATSVPSPAPAPSTAPSAGAAIYAAALPKLAAATNYTVYAFLPAVAGGNGVCAFAGGYVSVIGSFTTQ